ncbi:DUF5411 family protein [Viridibacillus arvi]|uniref:DUF5411 family protein n=1 Tax=Viridibacillus arvi TaxID=263475 RepID=UPI0034CD4130
MSKISFFGLWMIGYFLFMFYTIDVSLTSILEKDNEDAVEVAGRNAISQSINRGYLRVKEEMTIDPKVAEAVFLKSYAKNVGYNQADTVRKIDIQDISSNPPMLAVEVTTATASYTKNYLTIWDEYLNEQKDYTNSRQIIIYEAKSTTKPPKGGVSNK